MSHRYTLPKVCRIIILVSGNGTLTAATAEDYRYQFLNYRQRGFTKLASFRAPLRRLKHGWRELYNQAAISLIHAYGL
jgi:hypothetical protein